MIKLRGSVIAILSVAALACAALAMAQTQQSAPVNRRDRTALIAPRDSRMVGIDVVRQINTAEVEQNAWHGAYVSWSDLYNAPEEQKRWKRLQVSIGPEIVPGWTLDLVASADGKSFELSLRDLTDKCGFSFFSDQRGVIYEGSAIGCLRVEVVPAHR